MNIAKDLTQFLKKESDNYVLLRFEKILLNEKSEVDLVIRNKDLKKFLKRIKLHFRNKKYTVIKILDEKYKVLLKIIWQEGKDWKFTILDIRTNIVKKKWLLMDERLIKDTYSQINEDGLRVLRPQYESALILARNHADKREFSKKHKRILKKTFSKETLKVLKNLGFRFDPSKNYKTVRQTLKRKINIKRSLAGLKYGSIQRMATTIKKPREIVVFYGPDGSGKTTLTKSFIDIVKKAGIKFDYEHFFARPKVKKVINQGLMNKMKDEYVGSFIKNILSFIERQIFYWFNINTRRIKGTSFIFDRFFLDFAAKNKRFQKFYFKTLEKIFLVFSPKPTLVFYLDGDPKIINRRKNELTIEQIKKAKDFYDYLFETYSKHTPNLIKININGSLENSIKQLETEFYEYWSRKY